MTQDEIIEMARQAGFELTVNQHGNTQFCCFSREIEAFAKLVAAKEREACAKVCEDDCGNGALNLADAIRARGQE